MDPKIVEPEKTIPKRIGLYRGGQARLARGHRRRFFGAFAMTFAATKFGIVGSYVVEQRLYQLIRQTAAIS
jgi:hypothetical protein